MSEFLRRAADERARRTLQERPSEKLAGILGAVRSGGGQARRSGEAFAELLEERHRAR